MDDSRRDKYNLLFIKLKLMKNIPIFKPNLFMEFSLTMYDKSILLLVRSFLSFRKPFIFNIYSYGSLLIM